MLFQATGFHRWRNDWETFGGLIEPGERLRDCICRECVEELGISGIEFEYLGVIHYYMPPGYWVSEWHEEYGGLYGIRIKRSDIQKIEENRTDRKTDKVKRRIPGCHRLQNAHWSSP